MVDLINAHTHITKLHRSDGWQGAVCYVYTYENGVCDCWFYMKKKNCKAFVTCWCDVVERGAQMKINDTRCSLLHSAEKRAQILLNTETQNTKKSFSHSGCTRDFKKREEEKKLQFAKLKFPHFRIILLVSVKGCYISRKLGVNHKNPSSTTEICVTCRIDVGLAFVMHKDCWRGNDVFRLGIPYQNSRVSAQFCKKWQNMSGKYAVWF